MFVTRLALAAVIILLVSSCAVQQPPAPDVRYQDSPGQQQPEDSAVTVLQRNARIALQRGNFPAAIEYLQRAIKIEPRNALSWHYLAETYWQSGDLLRCSEMVDRSRSYSLDDDRLEHQNRLLAAKCGSI